MKKLTLTTLASACTLVLTACGGGGGGGGSTPIPTTSTSTVTPNTSSNTDNSSSSSNTDSSSSSSNTDSSSTSSNTNNGSASSNTNNGSASSNTDSSSASNAGSNNTTTDTPANKTNSVSEAFAKTGFNKMQTYAKQNNTTKQDESTYTEYQKLYDGIHIKIDNNTKTVTAQETVSDLGFQDFEFDGIKMVFLARRSDATKDIPTRKIETEDFPDGNFNPKDPNNPGYMGSYWSPINSNRDQGAFGRLRFGVYTDSNNVSHLFVHGTPATRAFKGTYKGSAIMGKDGNYTAYDRALTAVVNSDIDKIDITLKTDKTTLEFGGAVNANLLTFEGTKNGVSTRGGFFGSDLGGVFEVTEGVHAGENGVFGASNIDDKDFAASFTE